MRVKPDAHPAESAVTRARDDSPWNDPSNSTDPAMRGPVRHGARGTRTPDLLGAIQALSQLSYSPAGRSSVPGGGVR
jgi:hypothetical protein